MFELSIVYANTPSVELRGVRSERHVGGDQRDTR